MTPSKRLYRAWTPYEDGIVLRLRRRGYRWETIGEKINRTKDAVAMRYRWLISTDEERAEQNAAKKAREAAKPGPTNPDSIDFTKSNHARNVAGSNLLLKRLRIAAAIESRKVKTVASGSVPIAPRFVALQDAWGLA